MSETIWIDLYTLDGKYAGAFECDCIGDTRPFMGDLHTTLTQTEFGRNGWHAATVYSDALRWELRR